MKRLTSSQVICGSFIKYMGLFKRDVYIHFLVNTQSVYFYFTGWAYFPIAFGSS